MPDIAISGKTSFKASAVLLGQRLSLRAWRPADALASNPLAVEVKGGGVAVLFRYGVVVFFDAGPAAAAAFVAEIQPQIGNPYPTPETEEIEVRVDAGTREGMLGDVVVLDAVTIERLQVIADVLSKSVLLAYYESGIAASVDRIEPLAVELERTGRIRTKSRELLGHIGAALHSEHLMVGRAAVTDKPEILWDVPALEGLHLRLEDEFEIQERYAALEQKLGLITRTAQTLHGILDTRHALRLEWYIIILIVAEIFLSLYDLFIHRR
jgi:required for meiotic nuclear division protein 1